MFSADGQTFESVVALDRDTGAELAYFGLAFVDESTLDAAQRRRQRIELARLDRILAEHNPSLLYQGGTLDGQEAR